MHWSEIAAVILIVIGAAAMLALACTFAIVGWGIIRGLSRRSAPSDHVQTAHGEFAKQDGYWSAAIEWNGYELNLAARDVDGHPNPSLLAQLPQVLGQIALWERMAREQIPAMTPQHQLNEIADDHSADFVLGFSWDEDCWGEAIYVEFKDGLVLNWSSVD